MFDLLLPVSFQTLGSQFYKKKDNKDTYQLMPLKHCEDFIERQF